MGARVDLTQDVVLKALTSHLRDALKLNERNCYETFDPLSPAIPKGGDYFVTVSSGDGVFPEGEQDAGNLTEEWIVIVTAYSRIRLDSPDHDERLLHDPRRGMFELKRKILKALVGEDVLYQGNTFLRNLLYVKRAPRPQVVQIPGSSGNSGLALISLEFGVDWDWNIT